MKNAGCSTGQRRRMQPGRDALASSFYAVDADRLIIKERVKQTHGIRATTNAGNNGVRQPALSLHQLLFCLFPDHRLEVTYHLRIGVRAGNGANNVKMCLGIRHPEAKRFVHRVLKRSRTRCYGMNLRAEQAHAVNIRLLSPNIFFTHENFAFHIEQGAGGCCCNTMLTGTRFSNDLGFSHPLCQ